MGIYHLVVLICISFKTNYATLFDFMCLTICLLKSCPFEDLGYLYTELQEPIIFSRYKFFVRYTHHALFLLVWVLSLDVQVSNFDEFYLISIYPTAIAFCIPSKQSLPVPIV